MTGSPADEFGEALARGSGPPGMSVVSAQVVDKTENGVNLRFDGGLLLDVACRDSYRDRRAGDWVAVRLGAVPVVEGRLGPDPADGDESRIREIAVDAAQDLIAISAYTWGTAAPGAGYQQVTTLWTKKDANGVGVLYAQIGGADTSPTPPPTRPPKTVTLSPSDAGSWRGGRPDEYAQNPTQGDWTGGGNRRGAWFYGSAIAAACSGKTVASMRVQFTRRRGSGANASRPMHLYLHGYTSAPSGQLNLGDGPEELLSLSVGATGTATLPAAWRTALASGTARGLAIYAQGRGDYASFTGGRITITFSA
ncbi:hypothetical protein [Streptomyces sp. NPDC056987]|uniref:hypothetical protein n=1 Tax=Streptomyces sp. NPDC056987 TaxID=3345988 RepID=UPI0036386A37